MIDRAHIHTQIHSTRLKNSCTFEGCAREKQEIEDGSKQGCVQGEGSGGEGVKATQEARKRGGEDLLFVQCHRVALQHLQQRLAAVQDLVEEQRRAVRQAQRCISTAHFALLFSIPHTHTHTHTHTHKTARRQAQCTRAHLHVCALCFGDCAVVFISCGNLLVEVLGDASEAFGEDVKVVLHLELLLLFCKDLCVQLLSLLFQILQT